MVKETKSGYVTILGLPNAGKSTLMNALLGQKLAITTNKPQTTRKKIIGILSDPDYQIIFLDTPGILKPGYLLQEKMMEEVGQSIKDADVFLLLIDLKEDPDCKHLLSYEAVKYILNDTNRPKIVLLNKIDKSTEPHVKGLIEKFENSGNVEKALPISATIGVNIYTVLNSIIEYLPVHPKYYPDDIIADENERFFVTEIIRENILEQYKEEVPYSVEVTIRDFKEKKGKKDYISAEIIVERSSQKGIMIGKGGSAIKKLGESSREAIEKFLQRSVYLDLNVRVKEKWRSNERMLKHFGYGRKYE